MSYLQTNITVIKNKVEFLNLTQELGNISKACKLIEEAARGLALVKPAWGQVRASNELRRQGLSISPCGIRCVWIRYDLENINKRLKALETKVKVAAEGSVLTEDQLLIFERRKTENEAYGEIEEVQTDLNEWVRNYNFNRTHQGKMCNGG